MKNSDIINNCFKAIWYKSAILDYGKLETAHVYENFTKMSLLAQIISLINSSKKFKFVRKKKIYIYFIECYENFNFYLLVFMYSTGPLTG